jgi:hypothetical protein
MDKDVYYPNLFDSKGELKKQELVDTTRLLWEAVYTLRDMLDDKANIEDIPRKNKDA